MGLRSHFAVYGHIVLSVNKLIMQRLFVDNGEVVIECLNNNRLLHSLHRTKFLKLFDKLALDAKGLVAYLEREVVVFGCKG